MRRLGPVLPLLGVLAACNVAASEAYTERLQVSVQSVEDTMTNPDDAGVPGGDAAHEVTYSYELDGKAYVASQTVRPEDWDASAAYFVCVDPDDPVKHAWIGTGDGGVECGKPGLGSKNATPTP
ncbi:hypothetical protein [Nocardioides speluncae]|uniref:hypothetical protein n=1 Tax=Nocardioides speluncae TaxID=2670337 RepID=UPI0012B16A15|nr:hypothetical protein [Nocardioides speluncae]